MRKTTPAWTEQIVRRLDGTVTPRRDFRRHPALSIAEGATSVMLDALRG